MKVLYFMEIWNVAITGLYFQLERCGFKVDRSSECFERDDINGKRSPADLANWIIMHLGHDSGIQQILDYIQVDLVENAGAVANEKLNSLKRLLLVRVGRIKELFSVLKVVWKGHDSFQHGDILVSLSNELVERFRDHVEEIKEEVDRKKKLRLAVRTVLEDTRNNFEHMLTGRRLTQSVKSQEKIAELKLAGQAKRDEREKLRRLANEREERERLAKDEVRPFEADSEVGADSRHQLWRAVASLAEKVDVTHAALERMHKA